MPNSPKRLLAWACLAALLSCARSPTPAVPSTPPAAPERTASPDPAAPSTPPAPSANAASPAPEATKSVGPPPGSGMRRVEGQVLRDGKPKAGADVQWLRVWAEEGGPPTAEGDAGPVGLRATKTDADGRFAFQASSEGTFFVGTGDERATAARMLGPGEASSGIVLAAEPNGTLKIRVTDPGGAVVPGARVRVLHSVFEYDAAQRLLWAASAKALEGEEMKEPPRDPLLPTVGALVARAEPGVFRTAPLYAGVWHVLAAAPGYKPTVVRARREPGRERVLEVRLEPAAVVSGKVDGPG